MLCNALPVRLIADFPRRCANSVAHERFGTVAMFIDKRLCFCAVTRVLLSFSAKQGQHQHASLHTTITSQRDIGSQLAENDML